MAGFAKYAWACALASWAACGGGSPGQRRPETSQTASAEWTTHQDPSGLSIESPRGWRVTRDEGSGRIALRGAGGEELIVWPVFVPSQLSARNAGRVAQRLAEAIGWGAAASQPQTAGPTAVRIEKRAADRSGVAVLAWTTSPKGTAAYFYAVSAPPAVYSRSPELFSRILRSVRITGSAAAADTGTSFRWVRWSDPQENAFSFEIPDGWRIRGGLARLAAVDVRPAWELVSPDGDIRLTGGDASIPPHTEPNQMLALTGFREGSWYSPGYGVRMLVRRYLPGVAFAREYVLTRAAPGCAGTEITDARERPDAVSAINAVYAQYGPGFQMALTAGEAAFTCRKAGRSMQGYHFAGTMRTAMAGMPGGLWTVEYLFGYLAPEGKTGLAQQVLGHVLQTVRINPQWMAMQQGLAANTSQIVTHTSSAISEMISSTYWSRQSTMDELSRRRSNATLSVVDVIDPLTGRETKVESGSNYYWIDHRGAIVGTDTYSRPNLDFRELVQLP